MAVYTVETNEEIKVGETYYFGDLWDGDGDGRELLESGAISPHNDENVVEFESVDEDEDVLKVLVKVTDIC